MDKRFENWNKDEKICMNCDHRAVCKFASGIIEICKMKCEVEEIDLDARYNVSIGLVFNCECFSRAKPEGCANA